MRAGHRRGCQWAGCHRAPARRPAGYGASYQEADGAAAPPVQNMSPPSPAHFNSRYAGARRNPLHYRAAAALTGGFMALVVPSAW